MRIKLTCDRRCMIRGHQWAGEVIDLPDAEAQRLVNAQQAELVEEVAVAAEANKKRPRR